MKPRPSVSDQCSGAGGGVPLDTDEVTSQLLKVINNSTLFILNFFSFAKIEIL